MSGSSGGLGTSSQTFNAAGTSNNQSQVSPYAPTTGGLQDLINQINTTGGNNVSPLGHLYPAEAKNYQTAMSNINQLPNFGPQVANTAQSIFNTGGDPSGLLGNSANALQGERGALQSIFGNLQPYANPKSLDPTQTPGIDKVLETIRNDVSNQVNGQFAGAGRSLSGLNTQTLARGLGQGESVPLLNQYNQNFANMLQANQGQTGAVNAGTGVEHELAGNAQQRMANLSQGANFAQMAPQLAQMNPMMVEQLLQQMKMQPLNYLGASENLLNPIAGLGGNTVGQQQTTQSGSGTATNSLLSQLAQGMGLLNPLGKFVGTF